MANGERDTALDEESDMVEMLKGVTLNPDIVRDYLRRAGIAPLLTAAEEVQLAEQIEAGLFAAEALNNGNPRVDASKEDLQKLVLLGEAAYVRMIESNLRLVILLAKRHVGRGVELIDLIQEGNTGLMRAVQKFDYKKGYKFSTYATNWITQALNRSLADKGSTIDVPVRIYEKIGTLNKATARLTVKNGHAPTEQELAAELGISTEEIQKIIRAASVRQPYSLEMPIGEGLTLGELLSDEVDKGHVEAGTLAAELRETVERLLGSFKPAEQQAIMYYFGLDGGEALSITQIAEKMNISSAKARQLVNRAVSKLRHPSRANILRRLAIEVR